MIYTEHMLENNHNMIIHLHVCQLKGLTVLEAVTCGTHSKQNKNTGSMQPRKYNSFLKRKNNS